MKKKNPYKLTFYWKTESKISTSKCAIRNKRIKGISSNFINRPKVKSFIFLRDNFSCLYCNSQEHLTIDHIIPVGSLYNENLKADFIIGKLLEINSLENLQTLCLSCNVRKSNGTT